jgi:hypothetical protein
MPKRPPKQWWERCTRAVRKASPRVSAEKVCGASWYRKMSPAQKAVEVKLERLLEATGRIRRSSRRRSRRAA